MLTEDEMADLLTFASSMSLEDELAVVRVTLQRLMRYLNKPDLSTFHLASLAPLVFTGARAVAYLLHDIEDHGRSNVWDEVLDQMASDLSIKL